MESNTQEYSGIEVDLKWMVQGRIIPASCTEFAKASVLCLQIKHVEWNDLHYHKGMCPVPPELAVELVSAICIPLNSKLVCKSFDFKEQLEGLYYLTMVKLAHPLESLGFLTASGMTVVVKVDGVESLFGYEAEDCKECMEKLGDVGLLEHPSEAVLDQMLESFGEENVREH